MIVAGPSEKYWEVIAERRRKALEEVLEENQRLHNLITALEEENKSCKILMENSTDLINTLKVENISLVLSIIILISYYMNITK